MVGPVNSAGYQAYSYQQGVNPLAEVRGGENRIQLAPAPSGDSQRGNQRDSASRDEKEPSGGSGGGSDGGGTRGTIVNTVA